MNRINNTIINQTYFNAMVNKSYGYLWWHNGKNIVLLVHILLAIMTQ